MEEWLNVSLQVWILFEFLFLISYPSLLLYYYYWDILFLIQSLCYNCRTCLQFCLYTSSDSAFQVLYIYQRFPKGGCLTPYLGTLHKVVGPFFLYPEHSILHSLCPHCFIYYELNSLLFRRTPFAWRTNWKQSTHEVAPWPFLCNTAEYFHLSTDTYVLGTGQLFILNISVFAFFKRMLAITYCWWWGDEVSPLMLCRWAVNLEKNLWESYLSPFVKTLKMTVSLDPLISLLEIYPKAIILNTEKLYVNRNTI